MTWINGVLSITDYPVNYPMHFLRDLFVMCVFAPWIGKVLRSLPFVGLIVLFVIFVPNLDGQFIRNDTMIISFYAGGMAATLNWDLKRLDRYASLLICLLILICALGVFLRVGKQPWLPFLAPFVVWPALVNAPFNMLFGNDSECLQNPSRWYCGSTECTGN